MEPAGGTSCSSSPAARPEPSPSWTSDGSSRTVRLRDLRRRTLRRVGVLLMGAGHLVSIVGDRRARELAHLQAVWEAEPGPDHSIELSDAARAYAAHLREFPPGGVQRNEQPWPLAWHADLDTTIRALEEEADALRGLANALLGGRDPHPHLREAAIAMKSVWDGHERLRVMLAAAAGIRDG